MFYQLLNNPSLAVGIKGEPYLFQMQRKGYLIIHLNLEIALLVQSY